MKKVCPTCGGEGKLFRQVDVDYFIPTEVCPECEGTEWVFVKCDECQEPIEGDPVMIGKYPYHEGCVECQEP